MAAHVLRDDEQPRSVREGGAVDAARALVLRRRLEQLLHTVGERGRPHPQRRVEPREEPMIDSERDPAAAPRGEDPLGGQRHRMRQRDVGPAVDGRDHHAGDLFHAADDLLHPQVADDERLEHHG